MKVLLDSCVSGLARSVVEQAGHDVLWAGNWHPDPGDSAIPQAAITEERVLVTIDKDFGELVVARGLVHAGLIRLVGFRAAQQGDSIVRLLAAYEPELRAGALVTAEPWRVRLRPA